MIRDDILAKIHKCFALAASANEHEAATALAKARALMDAHGLTESDIDLSAIGEAAARGSRAQRAAKWEAILAMAVERAFSVRVILDGYRDWKFVGRGAAAEIASYAFTTLYRTLKRARSEYVSTQLRRCTLARKRLRADVFCEGWVHAVYGKVCKLVPKGEKEDELVSRYLHERFGDLVTATVRKGKVGGSRTDDDYWRGRERGHAAELNAGVGSEAAPARLT